MKPRNRLSMYEKKNKSKLENLNLRERPSIPFNPNPEHPLPLKFRLFFEAKVLPLLMMTGYKVEQKHELATHMIHSLICSAKRAACISDSRTHDDEGVKLRVQVWDAIVDAQLAIKALGSELSGKVTRYAATDKLMKLRKQWRLNCLVDLDLQRNTKREKATAHGLVYLHTGKIDLLTGEPLPSKKQKQAIHFKSFCTPMGLELLQSIEDIVEAFNAECLKHSWSVEITDPITGHKFSSPLNPCLRQLHCGEFFRAVRFYSWSSLSGQLLSKEQRKNILIDGEPVAELDFSASQLRMLYHLRVLDPKGDLYRPERIFPKTYAVAAEDQQAVLRGFVKRATLVSLNNKSRKQAHSSVGKLRKESEHRKYLRDAIWKVEKTDIIGIVQRIVEAHRKLVDVWYVPGRTDPEHPDRAEPFFTGIGLQMMTEESKVMRVMLQQFTAAKKPALMIHDSVVCKVSDMKFAKRTMIGAYQEMLTTDFEPVIKS